MNQMLLDMYEHHLQRLKGMIGALQGMISALQTDLAAAQKRVRYLEDREVFLVKEDS